MSERGGFLRAEYVLELIKYHCISDEVKFKKTVTELAKEEEKKGNTKLSDKLLDTYRRMSMKDSNSRKSGAFTYGPSSGLVMKDDNNLASPKDKASSNDLFNIVYPSCKSNDLVLPNSIKEKLMQIVFEYKNREKLREFELKSENRLLLCGPPGCGKTSTAYYLGDILNLPIAYVRLDSLITSLLGQTGTNIRKIFEAVKDQEIILFLDEFDAIAKKRDDNHELGELKRVVNTLLQNIDLLTDNVFLVAATNHENLLDPAVWRRFNTVLYLDLPDEELRTIYIKNKILAYEDKFQFDIDVRKFAKASKGLNFSDLEEIFYKAIKKSLIHEKTNFITTKKMIEILVNSTFLFNQKGKSLNIEKLKELRDNGLTLREISEFTLIPRSTLSDWLKK